MNYGSKMQDLLRDIEVAESEYEKAISRYNSITEYIGQSSLSTYEPQIYLQGSFKLGTAIKPLTEDGSYDIDLVCNLTALRKVQISQSELKRQVGVVIKNYTSAHNMSAEPKNGKRCWTISYVDNHNFHVDILPSLPNGKGKEIAITDKNNQYYNVISEQWEVSNPQGYYEWFISISKYNEYKKDYAVKMSVDVETVPYYKVKTPLQRIVQILKRHAEVTFEDDMEHKPSSVIITTLAAKAYASIEIANMVDFIEVLQKVIAVMENQIDYVDGNSCVLNPVDREENLSVKWGQDESYFLEFTNWLGKLKFDFSVITKIGNRDEQFGLIKRSLQKCSTGFELRTSLEALPYHLNLQWRDSIWKEVKIKATIYQKSFMPKTLESGRPICKGNDIKFEAIADNIYMYEIYWQVTNTGIEAQQVGQLRGDFYDSTLEAGKKIRKESTSYIGKHYVEAFLVKDGVCYGRSEPFEVNIVRHAMPVF